MSASIVHWSVGLTVDVHEQKAPSSSANGGKNQEGDSCSLMDCPFDVRFSRLSPLKDLWSTTLLFKFGPSSTKSPKATRKILITFPKLRTRAKVAAQNMNALGTNQGEKITGGSDGCAFLPWFRLPCDSDSGWIFRVGTGREGGEGFVTQALT